MKLQPSSVSSRARGHWGQGRGEPWSEGSEDTGEGGAGLSPEQRGHTMAISAQCPAHFLLREPLLLSLSADRCFFTFSSLLFLLCRFSYTSSLCL